MRSPTVNKTQRLIIAGIGSRRTPQEILPLLAEIGAHVRSLKGYVRSGHADGADLAFERGAQERTLVYMPWHGFGDPARYAPEKNYVEFNATTTHAKLLARASVNQYHPAADNPNFTGFSNAAMLLLARDFFQVLGTKGDDPVDAVICWAPPEGPAHGQVKGGTGQAVRIARAHGIPVMNLHTTPHTQIMSWLTLVAKRYTDPSQPLPTPPTPSSA